MDIKTSLKLAVRVMKQGNKGELTPKEIEKYLNDYPILKVYGTIAIVVIVVATITVCFLLARYVFHLY